MIKFALCSALCACSLMSAIELHSERVQSAEAVRELAEITANIVSLLRFEAADVYVICREAFRGARVLDYSLFSEIDSGDFPKRWLEACESLHLDKEALELFKSVGRVLGSCDIESQIERIERIRAELSARAKKLRERADSTKKMYSVLGALLGLGISIVII